MRKQPGIALLAAFLAACGAARSEELQPKKPTRTFGSARQMRPIYSGRVGEFVEGFDLKLSGGPFPASFWADERCSATLIGPRVLLSAAHCFESDRDVTIKFDGKFYDGLCDTATKFTQGAVDVDVVLCRMTKSVPVPRFETISFDTDLVKKDVRLMLTGFGGSEVAGKSPGTYLAGESTVASVDVHEGIAMTTGGAFLRDGDSGGAGYVSPGSGRRRLISVNAAVITKTQTSSVHLLSAARSFFDRWVKGDKVCGLDQRGLSCF